MRIQAQIIILFVGFIFTLAATGLGQYGIPARPGIIFAKINGEVKWGSIFRKQMSNGLILEVRLLGKLDDSQNGFIVSVLNPRNPTGHQFVLLPEFINGQQSCFIGIWNDTGHNAERLKSILDRYRITTHTFFTDNLSEAVLKKVEAANLTLGHHGLDEKEGAAARNVLSSLHQVIAEFEILNYRIANQDPSIGNTTHIEYLSFSFQPSSR